ncbi:MAG: sodium/proton antiporter NhaB [Syntrophobacteraceae bacterium]
MPKTTGQALKMNFLGESPSWYKLSIIGFLVLNPIIMWSAGSFIAGWVLVAEFIFTLAMALKCYPLPPAGLLALESVILGMARPNIVYDEVARNLPVILLLMFMVAGIYFMKELLQYLFTRILLGIRSKILLSLLFCGVGAFLSAFLDALTVTAVVISVAYGFYDVYHRFLSVEKAHILQAFAGYSGIDVSFHNDLENYRGFLRNLMMHAAVGTALGGVTTLVGEPQNLLVACVMGWNFGEFFVRVAPVSIPVFVAGLITCALLEKFRILGYGFQMPDFVRTLIEQSAKDDVKTISKKRYAGLFIQGGVGCLLIICLGFHLAEVGLIGLMAIILLTAMNGITEEHRIGRAFEEALPFTALLIVFFVIVAVIHEQHLFAPVIDFVMTLQGKEQLVAYYLANGVLSAISDNVFVATVYITETANAFADGRISREQFDLLAVSINTGTNIPSVATPNGQAAFLFLLTSALAPLIRLSYGEMVKLALPYTISMTGVGLLATYLWL